MKRLVTALFALCLGSIPVQAADPTHLVPGQKIRIEGYYCHVLLALRGLMDAQKLPDGPRGVMQRSMVGNRSEGKVCYHGVNLVTIVAERGKVPAALYGDKPDYLFEVLLETGATMFVNSSTPGAPSL